MEDTNAQRTRSGPPPMPRWKVVYRWLVTFAIVWTGMFVVQLLARLMAADWFSMSERPEMARVSAAIFATLWTLLMSLSWSGTIAAPKSLTDARATVRIFGGLSAVMAIVLTAIGFIHHALTGQTS